MAKTTINGSFRRGDDTPETGYVTFALSTTAFHEGEGVLYTRVPLRVNLDNDGDLTVQLQPTEGVDADWSVEGLSYLVEERFAGKSPRRYYMSVPTSGSPVDFGDLATYATAPTINANQDLSAEWVAWQADANATYAPLVGSFQPGLVDSLPDLLYVGHRGGSSRFPEHSMEGYRATAASGFALDCDIRALSDGTLVVQHDAALSTATDGTGNVIDATLATYLAARTDAPVVSGGAYTVNKAVPVLWDQVLAEFGGRNLIVAEAKTSAVVDDLTASITARGLQRAVILASFNYGDCIDFVAAGIPAMYLADVATPYTWASIAAAGIEHIGMSTAVSGATVAAAQAEGLRVHIYTVSTLASQTTELAKGPEGLFSSDPWWLTGRYVKGDRDEWSDQVPWPGMIDTGSPLTLRPPRALTALYGSNTAGWADCRGLFGTRDASSGVVKVRFRLRFRPYAVNQTRWAGIFVGITDAEQCYDDTATGRAGQQGYTCLIKRDGTLQVYYHAPSSSASSLGTTAGTVIAAASAEGEALIEFEINAATVVLRNLTTNQEFSNAHTTHRGAAVHLALGFNSTDIEMTDCTFYKAS